MEEVMKKTTSNPLRTRRSRRVKCACASCQCTVDMEHAVRKGNLLYCGRACLTECTRDSCRCEHDHCAI